MIETLNGPYRVERVKGQTESQKSIVTRRLLLMQGDRNGFIIIIRRSRNRTINQRP